MRRVPIGERPDWGETARRHGFTFHTFDGAAYWSESHAYAFKLAEIEDDLEAPSTEIHALCLAFVADAVEDERILASLDIPSHAWDAIPRELGSGETPPSMDAWISPTEGHPPGRQSYSNTMPTRPQPSTNPGCFNGYGWKKGCEPAR